MKSKNLENIGEILSEMGFNPKASVGAQAAFLKHLIRQAYNVEVQIPEALLTSAEKDKTSVMTNVLDLQKAKKTEQEQMSFVFDDDKKVANG